MEYNTKEEKTMKNKRFWLGMLVMVLVFGLTAVGCDNDSTGDNNSGGNNSGSGNVPNAPTGVNATRQTANSVLVKWNSVSGATSYNVYWSYSSSGQYTFDGSSNSTSFTSTGWGASETGFIRVTAVNSKGEGSQSSPASFQAFTGGGVGGSKPGTPQGVNLEKTSNVVAGLTNIYFTIRWNAVSGAQSYNVYMATSYNGSYTKNNISPITTTSYSSFYGTYGQNLTTQPNYYFKITAVNSNGESEQSSIVYIDRSAIGGYP